MRKTLLIAASFLLTASLCAQQKNQVPTRDFMKGAKKVTIDPSTTYSARNANSLETEARWLNWGERIQEFQGDDVATISWVVTTLSDSLGLIQFSDGQTQNVFVNSIATSIIPSDPEWGWLSPYNNAILDSVDVRGAYTRGTNVAENVVDTIRITIANSFTSLGGIVDSDAEFPDVTYDSATNQIPSAATNATYDIYLTPADATSEEEGTSFFSVNNDDITLPTVNVSDVLASNVTVSVQFIAGNDYVLNDIIGEDISEFLFATYEEFGEDTEPESYGTHNHSYIAPSTVRYENNANGWNGRYIPTAAWEQPSYSYEDHAIGMKIISNSVTIDETNEVSFNVYPNPSTGLVKVVTNNNGHNQTIDVKNILGQEVMNIVSADDRVELDMTSFRKGVYFVTVTNKGSQITKKITIQ